MNRWRLRVFVGLRRRVFVALAAAVKAQGLQPAQWRPASVNHRRRSIQVSVMRDRSVSCMIAADLNSRGLAASRTKWTNQGVSRQSTESVSKSKRKKKHKSKPAKAPRPREPAPAETRGAEVLTVAWMLVAFATVIADVVMGLAWFITWLQVSDDVRLQTIPRLATFVAAISGLVGLSLTPLVIKVRQNAPPQPITFAVIAIGLLPWLVIAAMVISIWEA